MANVTVPSDRAVLGRLPPVCVRTGAPADGRVTVLTKVGAASPWALLLIFFGPPGWLVLLGISLAMRGVDLEVRLPFSRSAWATISRTTVTGYALCGVGIVGFGTALLMGRAQVGLVASVGVVLTGIVVVIVAKAMLPRIDLDATRNWATLRGVHPRFRAAVCADPALDPLSR